MAAATPTYMLFKKKKKKKKKNDVHNGVSQKECPKIDNL